MGVTPPLIVAGTRPPQYHGRSACIARKDRTDAEKRTERPPDADRSWLAHGCAVPQLLAAGDAGDRAAGERLPAGAGQAPGRAADRLARRQRQLRPARRV